MDFEDEEHLRFEGYPCTVCGSQEYRYYDGGYNCREGHRNEALLEQFGDDEDVEFLRGRHGRVSQLAASRVTQQSSRVSQRQVSKRSGKGDHDATIRYAISKTQHGALFAEESRRFTRHGDKRKYVLCEALMQILIRQIEEMSQIYPELQSPAGRFEKICRNFFLLYCNRLQFVYGHSDTDHPELINFVDSTDYLMKGDAGGDPAAESSAIFAAADCDRDDNFFDDDFTASDLEIDEESGRVLRRREIKKATELNPGSFDNTALHEAPKSATKPTSPTFGPVRPPFSNSFSTQVTLLIIYLGAIEMGVPLLFSDLARDAERGRISAYRPDFFLSKDIVTVRMTIYDLRAFNTRHLPNAQQLHHHCRAMLAWLDASAEDQMSNEPSAVITLTVDVVNRFLQKIMQKLCLPSAYEPFIRWHLNRICPLRYSTLPGSMILLSPCVLVTAASVFFLRLLYGLRSDDDELHAIDPFLNSLHLPTQSELMAAWHWNYRQHELLADEEHMHEAITDPDEFDRLIIIANKQLGKTALLDSSPAIKGIFGSELFNQVASQADPKTYVNSVDAPISVVDKFYWMSHNHNDDGSITITPTTTTATPRNITPSLLPRNNYARYHRYSLDVDDEHRTYWKSLHEPYQSLLLLVNRVIGIKPEDLERVIQTLFEPK